MKALTAETLHGTWAPVLLPIAEDDAIDWGRLRAQLDVLAASGVQGVYTNGTSGEFWAQSEAEYEQLSRLTAAVCEKAGMAFQLGASHPCPQTCLERISVAKSFAPGAIQVILADWFPVRMVDAIACLERFAAAADPVPLVLYNPDHAKRTLTPDEIRQVKAAIPSLIGTKGPQWQKLLPDGVPGLAIFAGGRLLAEGYAIGARGAYSEVACMNPFGAARWYELMKTDLPKAREIGERITAWRTRYAVPLMEQYGFAGPFNDKLFAAVGNWADIGTRMRWPYGGAPLELALPLREPARELVPEIFGATP